MDAARRKQIRERLTDGDVFKHAPEDVADLLAEVERLQEEVERLRRLAEVRATEILRLDAMIAPWPDR
jgi:hypothetical protein